VGFLDRLIGRAEEPLDPAIAATLDLRPGERVMAWGRSAAVDEAYIVASDRALHLPPHTRRELRLEPDSALSRGPESQIRLPWDRVIKATWEEPLSALTVQPTPGGANRLLQLRIDDPGNLPATIRERVLASIVVSQHVALEGDAGARIVARRDFDAAQGEPAVRWAVLFDAGLDPNDPVVRAGADAALADLRGSLGL